MQNIHVISVAKQSALEKAKAEAKAKKLRDEKETASAFEDFVKEFDADIGEEKQWVSGGTEGGMLYSTRTGTGSRMSLGGGARRHFTTRQAQVLTIGGSCIVIRLGRRNRFTGWKEEEFGFFPGRIKEVP